MGKLRTKVSLALFSTPLMTRKAGRILSDFLKNWIKVRGAGFEPTAFQMTPKVN